MAVRHSLTHASVTVFVVAACFIASPPTGASFSSASSGAVRITVVIPDPPEPATEEAPASGPLIQSESLEEEPTDLSAPPEDPPAPPAEPSSEDEGSEEPVDLEEPAPPAAPEPTPPPADDVADDVAPPTDDVADDATPPQEDGDDSIDDTPVIIEEEPAPEDVEPLNTEGDIHEDVEEDTSV